METDKFYLQWNVVNWVTVVLMASVGFLAVGVVYSGLKGMQGGDE